jgi:hypothetical protein
MIIEHETSPEIALLIFRTGKFTGGPILGDNGLNAIPVGSSGYWLGQAESKGAVMEFAWEGEVLKDSPISHQPDILYDQKPHRVFLFSGTSKHLYLQRIYFIDDSSWSELLPEVLMPAGFHFFNLFAWIRYRRSRSQKWKEQKVHELRAEIATLNSYRKSIAIL